MADAQASGACGSNIVWVAGVAELADAQASGACGSNIVWVQVPSPASFFVLYPVAEVVSFLNRIFYFYGSDREMHFLYPFCTIPDHIP